MRFFAGFLIYLGAWDDHRGTARRCLTHVLLGLCGLGATLGPTAAFDRVHGVIPRPILLSCLDFPLKGVLPNPQHMQHYGYDPAQRLTQTVQAVSYRRKIGSHMLDRINGRGVTISFAPRKRACVITVSLPAAGSHGVLAWLDDQMAALGYPRLPVDDLTFGRATAVQNVITIPIGALGQRVYHAGSQRLSIFGKQVGAAAILRISPAQ